MRMFDIISKKSDGLPLTKDEIYYFVNGYTDGNIPDYQASALLMAIYLRGMTDEETFALTEAMASSGKISNLSCVKGVTADKHSTGGVGDKTTLVVVPTAASLGIKISKLSGRGLGHTGGTIDKLESISGFNTQLTNDEILCNLNTVGACVSEATADLAPADKKLYALRDATATVASIPLIASSIMSKKLASGCSCIVIDVKMGSGAFMKTYEDAHRLARLVTAIGKNAGKKTCAVITNMDVPLGYAIGNSLEVAEAVGVLKGEIRGDLYDECVLLTAAMLKLAEDKSIEECKCAAKDAIDSGRAYRKLKEIVAAQGGDVRQIEDTSLLPQAKYSREIISPKSGYIAHMDTAGIGRVSVILGAGREKKGDEVSFGAGIILKAKTGDCVLEGNTLAVVYSDIEETLDTAQSTYLSCIEFTNNPPCKNNLVYGVAD